jgi:hypothetical protein
MVRHDGPEPAFRRDVVPSMIHMHACKVVAAATTTSRSGMLVNAKVCWALVLGVDRLAGQGRYGLHIDIFTPGSKNSCS